jgi:hypothetical protein
MAATTESFNAILKRYTPFALHMEMLKRHNWFIEWVPKKTDWYGGTMEIPFEAAQAANFSWGALSAANDLGEDNFLMGTLSNSDLKELWGTMKIHNKDLRRHNGDMKRSYLQILPQRLTRFTQLMSQMVSISYFGDGSIDSATVDGTSGGIITVNYPHRFNIGQKVVVDDDNSSSATGYIVAIDINTKQLHIQDARTGGSDVDLSGYTVAQNAKVYNPGQADIPVALKDILLSAANGGSTNYFGYAKATYPALQAKNIDGSSFTQATLLDDLYGAYYEVLDQGKGSLDKTMVMPLKFMQYISSGLENNKRYEAKQTKVGYGMREVEIYGPDGMAKFVAIRDIDPTLCFILDKKGMSLCGNSFFKRDVDANGNEFYVTRDTTGKVNIVDTCFEGALVVQAPSHQGVVHSIPNSLPAS